MDLSTLSIPPVSICCEMFDLPLLTSYWEQGMAQWWEHLPPTNVAQVQIPASTPYAGWVCCWFTSLLWEVFLRVLQFSPLLWNQLFQIPIRPGIRYTKNHFVDVLPPNHYLFIYLFYLSISNVKNAWWAEDTHTIWKKSCYQKYNARKSPFPSGIEYTLYLNKWLFQKRSGPSSKTGDMTVFKSIS